jgi:hypothetical protein
LPDIQHQVAFLQQELTVEVGLKLQAEAVAADLAAKVGSGRAVIVHLNIKERKLRDQVDGKISPAFTALFEFFGRLFDVVNLCLDSPRREAWTGGGGTPMPGEGARRGEEHPPQGI